MKKFFEFLGYLTFSIASFFGSLFVLRKIWDLVLVPIGAPHVTLKQLWGVCFFFAVLSYKSKKTLDLKEVTKEELEHCVALLIAWAVTYLIFG